MNSHTDSHHDPLDYHRIAQLAYQLWEQRGRPVGSPDVDWSAAIAILSAKHPDKSASPQRPTAPPPPDNSTIPNTVNTDELFNDEDTLVPLTPALASFS